MQGRALQQGQPPTCVPARRRLPRLQAFPAYQGLAPRQHGSSQLDAAAVRAAATPTAVARGDAAVLEDQKPVNLYTEAADMEEILEELDACGVRTLLPYLPLCSFKCGTVQP